MKMVVFVTAFRMSFEMRFLRRANFCPEGGGWEGRGGEGGGPRVGPKPRKSEGRSVGGKHFAVFFFRLQLHSFFSLSREVFSWNRGLGSMSWPTNAATLRELNQRPSAPRHPIPPLPVDSPVFNLKERVFCRNVSICTKGFCKRSVGP